jgi:hypothetical protein
MKSKDTKTTTITLIKGEEEALQAIAEKMGTKSRSGPSSGKITWRELIHQIAGGHLTVNRPGASSGGAKAPRARKPFKAWAKYPPKWWIPGDQNMMPVASCVTLSGRAAEELEKGGLRRLDEEFVGLGEWAK